jgi:membrane protease YdiL (CAAX protease family)
LTDIENMTIEPPWTDPTPPSATGGNVDPTLPPPFGPARRTGGVLVLYFLMLMGMILVGGITQFFFGFEVNALVTELGVLLLPVIWILRRQDPWMRLGMSRPLEARALLPGLVGVLGLAVLLAEFTHWTDKVFPMPEVFREAYLQAVTAETPAQLLMLLLAAAIVPGLCEEVVFRGYFQQIYSRRFGAHRGILVAAVLFAIMHLDPWHLPALFLIGLYLGYLFVWTGSLWVPVCAHAANNAASIILLYAAPEAALSQMNESPPTWALGAGALVLLMSIRWLMRLRPRQNAWPSSESEPDASLQD